MFPKQFHCCPGRAAPKVEQSVGAGSQLGVSASLGQALKMMEAGLHTRQGVG